MERGMEMELGTVVLRGEGQMGMGGGDVSYVEEAKDTAGGAFGWIVARGEPFFAALGGVDLCGRRELLIRLKLGRKRVAGREEQRRRRT